MSKYILALAALLIASPTFAQKTIGGVVAPNAITLRVIRITQVNTPEHLIAGSITTTESSSGNTIVVENATTRYNVELHCSPTYRTPVRR
jgi:hypothetical protein